MAAQEPYDYRRFSLAERDRRWKAVREKMERDGIFAIVAPPNTGNSTDWQGDARYLSHCGGGADSSIGCVFPLEGEPMVAATSAVRWGPRVQEWVQDVRDVNRHYGRAMADKLREINADGKRIGISGLSGGTRTPEGTIVHGTFEEIRQAVPNSELVNATDLLQEVRCIKSEEEIAVLQESVDLIEKGYEAEIEWAAKPGVKDYEVWAAAMYAMFSRGSEMSVHYNWIADNPPTRTLTRPQRKVLKDGDIIINEMESSIIGYRAQQTRPVAVRTCDSVYVDLMEIHREMYDRVLERLKPGTKLSEIIEFTSQVGQQLLPKSGPLSGGDARFVAHGRGLGDDFPLATNAEAVKRFGDWQFPENGVFIIKPSLQTGSHLSLGWGDTCRITANGAVRMGKGAHEMIIAR